MLIIQSLLLLPFITSSLSLGMNEQKSTSTQQNKKKRNKKYQYKKQESSYKDITTKNIPQIQCPSLRTSIEKNSTNSNPYAILLDSINFPRLTKENKQPTNSPEISHEEPNEFFKSISETSLNHDMSTETLSQSVIMITKEEKGFGLFGSLSYYLGDSIKNIISYLQSNTFDVENASHFNLLYEAIQKAIENKDSNALATITALCQSNDNYKQNIRINNELAETGFTLYKTIYQNEVTHANEQLQVQYKKHALEYNNKTIAFAHALSNLIDSYNHDIANIITTYETTIEKKDASLNTIKKEFSQLAALNTSIREKTQKCQENSYLILPHNEIDLLTRKDSNQQEILNILKITSNKLPKIELKEFNNK